MKNSSKKTTNVNECNLTKRKGAESVTGFDDLSRGLKSAIKGSAKAIVKALDAKEKANLRMATAIGYTDPQAAADTLFDDLEWDYDTVESIERVLTAFVIRQHIRWDREALEKRANEVFTILNRDPDLDGDPMDQ